MKKISQRTRWLIRDVASLPLKLPGATWICRRLGRSAAIISFHNVLENDFDSGKLVHNVDIDITTFEKQLCFLKKNYAILPIHEIRKWPSVKGIFLSFDDGLLNNYTTVAPVLNELGLTAMFSICPALIDRNLPFLWRDWLYLGLCNWDEKKRPKGHQDFKLSLPSNSSSKTKEELFRILCPPFYVSENPYKRLKKWFPLPCDLKKCHSYRQDRFSPMSWKQIRDLKQNGHFIASHLMTHCSPRYMTYSALVNELSESKSTIKQQLDQTFDYLVFPYGNQKLVSDYAIQLAEKEYDTVFMNQPGNLHSLNTLPRFGLPNTTNRTRLLASTSGYLERLKR